jgi:predicted negative regulator of RcsB-dependent stress response
MQSGSSVNGKAEKRLFQLLFREIQKARGPQQKALRDLRDELCTDMQGEELWEAFIQYLRRLDSPDALFEVFQALETAISHDVVATSPLHASGMFGQFARCAVLAFKDASFEATVRLYDAIAAYMQAYEKEVENEIVADVYRHQRDIYHDEPLMKQMEKEKLPAPEISLGTSQLEELAQGLVRDLPASFGRVPFPVVEKALGTLREKLPLCHVLHFLRYINCLQHRMADDAANSLRAFHDGHQQRGLVELRTASGWPLGVPPEDGLPDLVQHASLALAGLQTEMRHVDDAVQAISESIRAAQEASDGGCLCACLYMLSLVQIQAGHTDKAFTMMRRCLHGSEAKGLPMLQALCCLGIARALSAQPALSDRRRRGLLWKESISRMAAETQPATAALRTQGTAGAGSALAGGGAPSSNTGRGFGGGGNPGGGARGGLGVLAALLGHASRDEAFTSGGSGVIGQASCGDDSAIEGAACRDALAHVTLASQLSTQAGSLGEARPKVLLCQAEVARLFGLQPLTAASCGLALDVYQKELVAEDRALALCQLATAAAERSLDRARPLFQDVARQLPHARHLWAHIVGPRLLQSLMQAGECAIASALLFQAAGVVRTVPHGSATNAAQRLRVATNGMRLYHRQLLAAYRSAREAVEKGPRTGAPSDVCCHLLCLTDVHLEAQDPIGALGPCLRCLSAAEHARLLNFRAEALVRLARVKLEMRDLPAALQLAEGVTPQLSTSGSARLRGEAFLVQADVLLALAAKHHEDECSHLRLLKEAAVVFESAAEQFAAVAELNPLRRCHYLLARTYHQVGDVPRRNACATKFRQISEFLDGSGRCQSSSWESLGLSAAKRPVDAASDEAFKSNIDMPSSKPSYIPSTPPSWGVGTSPNGRVSARPAGTLGGSNAVGSALMGGAFGEVSPFTYAFDAAEAAAAATAVSARDGDVGSSQDATALDPRQGRCPALAQLLAVAEAAGQDGAHASSTTAPAKQGQPPGSLNGLLPPVGGATCGMKTVIGTICSPYPMAAVLAARD